MSIQFPTIFALGIEGLGPLRRAGASLIVMAIIGGAGLTALMGLVSDMAGITNAMLVPVISLQWLRALPGGRAEGWRRIDMGRLQAKRAIVTGAGQGIGRAAAELFARKART
ncbi:L-fucose permease [Sphingomonas paucimobilis]|nr:L-fucose permease [Sphingomonas paucimobilis]